MCRSAARELVDNGAAYFCFCTPHRLEMLRKDALRRRQVPRYDNRCRNITKSEVQEKIYSGAESCIRLKVYKLSVTCLKSQIHYLQTIPGFSFKPGHRDLCKITTCLR